MVDYVFSVLMGCSNLAGFLSRGEGACVEWRKWWKEEGELLCIHKKIIEVFV